MLKSGNNVIKGALALGVGTFIAKLLGAVYRVPLTNLLGGTGLGLYQMIFPVYAVLLDFSGAGVPSAMSKLISASSEEKKHLNGFNYFVASKKLLFYLGLVFALLMCICSYPLSLAQGNSKAWLGYVFLSPAVMLVAFISCYRGYFQGLLKMNPTAFSQIIEQVVKVLFGILFVIILRNNVIWAVAGATFAITISELVALGYLKWEYLKHKNALGLNFKRQKTNRKLWKNIIKIALPVTLVGVLIPLSQIIDSFMVLNIVGGYRKDATMLYGLLTGVVATVIGLPVSICYGIAVVSIPTVSRSKTIKEKDKNAVKVLWLTILFSLPCALFCYFYSPFIINLLFRGLSSGEKTIAVNLLKITSPCIVFLSFLQTGNAVLVGKGKAFLPLFSLGIGVIIKEILNFILLKNQSLNIYGGAIAVIACYFTVCLINLILSLVYR